MNQKTAISKRITNIPLGVWWRDLGQTVNDAHLTVFFSGNWKNLMATPRPPGGHRSSINLFKTLKKKIFRSFHPTTAPLRDIFIKIFKKLTLITWLPVSYLLLLVYDHLPASSICLCQSSNKRASASYLLLIAADVDGPRGLAGPCTLRPHVTADEQLAAVH